MNTRVLYYGREAILTVYQDFDCLKFKKSEGKPNFEDRNICEFKDLPDDYVVYLWSLSIEDRKNIQFLEGELATKQCLCHQLGRCDAPARMKASGVIEIIGEDPLEYDAGDFVDSKKFARVRCLSCGCEYHVNLKLGYRTSYFNWEKV